MDLKEFTLEQAKPLEGTLFQLATPSGATISLTLEEALPFETQQRRRKRGPALTREPFALYFVAPPHDPLEQGMYTLQSESVTFEDLFIVPVGKDESGAVEYEAVFN